MKFRLKDLKSRTKNFVCLGIDLPADELLKAVIIEYFSEKQIVLRSNVSDYIVKNINDHMKK